jgi:hypothetical protein
VEIPALEEGEPELDVPRPSRYERIRAAAAARGIPLSAILTSVSVVVVIYLAGKIAYRMLDVLDAVGHSDVPLQGVVGGGGQLYVVAVATVRQFDREVVVHVLHPGHALDRDRRRQVLRVARHGAVERDNPAGVLHRDVRRVDERVERQLILDSLADILCAAHGLFSLSGLRTAKSANAASLCSPSGSGGTAKSSAWSVG